MTEIVRTDMYCHDCDNNFIAVIDYNIDGNHEIICPHCSHIHYRLIKKGKITSDRWNSSAVNNVVDRTERIWTDKSLRMKTSSTSRFLRERWLNHGK